MFYIIGLFLIIGLALGGFTGSLPWNLNQSIAGIINSILGDFKNKALGFAFSKSENEILIDNLNSNYNLLDRFFSESSDAILDSKDISGEEKESFKQALKTFNKTKEQVKTLSGEVAKNRSGIVESLIKKTFGLDDTVENNVNNPDPTYIPPNCNLVCGE